MEIVCIKLFQLISAKSMERRLITEDPSYFIEIAEDFCKKQ